MDQQPQAQHKQRNIVGFLVFVFWFFLVGGMFFALCCWFFIVVYDFLHGLGAVCSADLLPKR